MQAVSNLANILDLSDFEIFKRAYIYWHGCTPDVRQLEREFGQCLLGKKSLPVYVKSFLQKKHFIWA